VRALDLPGACGFQDMLRSWRTLRWNCWRFGMQRSEDQVDGLSQVPAYAIGSFGYTSDLATRA